MSSLKLRFFTCRNIAHHATRSHYLTFVLNGGGTVFRLMIAASAIQNVGY
ncbi:hypothetical protein ACFL3F_02230 [Planctomycetota bacterium]